MRFQHGQRLCQFLSSNAQDFIEETLPAVSGAVDFNS